MDILRKRGNNYFETVRKRETHVLVFDYKVILEGRAFDRPVHYDPARIIPRKTDILALKNGPSSFLLVRGSGKEPDTICGRIAWRDLAHLTLIRPWRRHI